MGTRFRICEDNNPCTDNECVGDGCTFTNNTAPCNDEDPCTENDHCSGGTCSGTPKDCDDDDPCTIHHRCDPQQWGACLHDPYCADDGDPCTIETCDQETLACESAPMWPEYTFCDEVEGDAWTVTPGTPIGGRVFVNDDDDNANGIADNAEAGVDGEDDLRAVDFATISGGSPFTECGCQHNDDLSFYLWSAYAASDAWSFHLDARGTQDVSSCQPLPPPAVLYVEGLSPTSVCGVPPVFRVSCPCCVHHCGILTQPIQIIGVKSVAWEKGDPSNANLENNAPINGGVRIFPDKLSPQDNEPAKRRQVKLVATIEPPIADVTVYFKVWDVDDPFDQKNPNMPDVGIIDGDASGPDNRPAGEQPWTGTDTTDENGKTSVIFTVSMQPGNNYRAGVSVLQDAVQQADQTKADSLGHGFASGYSVPLVWSPMLTVWRKLHVEVDSMSAEPTTVNGRDPDWRDFDAWNVIPD
jgi:hypothetical protein